MRSFGKFFTRLVKSVAVLSCCTASWAILYQPETPDELRK